MTPAMNALLANLPVNEYEMLTQDMQLVSLKKGATLFSIGQVPMYVYYPVGAVVSMVVETEPEMKLETYMLGKTCMVGVAALNKPSFYHAIVRSGGLAYRLPVASLLKHRASCHQYMLFAQEAWLTMTRHLSQSIVCGKLHKLEQQLVRWILVSLDRSLAPVISTTHREISSLLGFRREYITLTTNRFADKNLIAQSRGKLEILNRAGLEEMSCDCYWLATDKKRPSHLSQLRTLQSSVRHVTA